jgi:hypothetical protein
MAEVRMNGNYSQTFWEWLQIFQAYLRDIGAIPGEGKHNAPE